MSRRSAIEHILRRHYHLFDWTADGLQRHTVYIGLRADKPAEEVRREANAETRSRWRRPPLQLRPRGIGKALDPQSYDCNAAHRN